MTLYLIGLGLCDEKDISVKGLEAIKVCDYIFLEYYTSLLPHANIEKLEAFYGKQITIADRELVEQHAETILEKAANFNVSFLIAGDVFGATTHTDLFLRAKNANIEIIIINNASIINAIANTGLELYKFGKTTSLPFFDEDWKPKNAYDAIIDNLSLGMHTLVLLDIKVSEASRKGILKGEATKLPPRFMTVNQAIEQFLELEKIEKKKIFTDHLKILGCARIGCPDQNIKYGEWEKLIKHNFGGPMHCIVIPGKLHHIEDEALKQFQ